MAQPQALSPSFPVTATQVDANRATAAYIGFLAFIVTIYSALPQLIPAADAISPGKTVIGFAAVALAWAVVMGRRRFQLGTSAGVGAFYIFFAIALLSPIWSKWPDTALDAVGESIKFLAAIVLAVNVLDTRHRIRTATKVIVLASLFPALGAIQSYFTGTNLVEGDRGSWLASFSNPNFIAYFLVVSTPMALALAETARRGSLARWTWLGIVGLFAVGVLVSGSRGGFLGMGAVVLYFVLRSGIRARAVIAATIVLGAVLYLTPMNPFKRAETRDNLSGQVDASALGRLDAWGTAVNMVEANPFLGIGSGTFVTAFNTYKPSTAGLPRAAHNTFVLVAAELGLPALAIFVYGLIASFRSIGRAAKRSSRRGRVVAYGIQTSLVGICVCSLTGGYAYTWPLFLTLGLGAAVVLRERAEQAKVRVAEAAVGG